MSNSILTNAGIALIGQCQANQAVLNIDKFVFADIDGLDPETTPDPTTVMADITDDIVHQPDVSQNGLINNDTVVYSAVLDSDTGDFYMNFMGLYCTEHATLVAICYMPRHYKYATGSFRTGNTLYKNFATQISNASNLTGITINAETWQINMPVKTVDKTYTVGSSTGEYSTIAEALTEIYKYNWSQGCAPTISLVDEEIYDITTPINLNINYMKLIGTVTTTTLTSIDSVTGSAGNFTITATLADASDLFFGSVIAINPIGTGTYKNFSSCYRVLTVNTGTGVVTLACKCPNASIGATTDVTGGAVTKYLTPIRTTSASINMIEPKASTTYVEDMALYSNDKSNGQGIYAITSCGIICTNTSVLENSVNYITGGGVIIAESSNASNAGTSNYYCSGGTLQAPSSNASNAGSNNYYCTGGSLQAASSNASNAGSNNYYGIGGTLQASSSSASNAGSINYYCIGGSMRVPNSTSSASNYNYYCTGGGSINAQGSNSISPNNFDYNVRYGGTINIAAYTGTATSNILINTPSPQGLISNT